MAITVLALLGGSLGLAAPADAAIVLNRSERSCYWGCSPYRQTNGAYNPSFGSNCVTKRWTAPRTTTIPPGYPCR